MLIITLCQRGHSDPLRDALPPITEFQVVLASGLVIVVVVVVVRKRERENLHVECVV